MQNSIQLVEKQTTRTIIITACGLFDSWLAVDYFVNVYVFFLLCLRRVPYVKNDAIHGFLLNF